MRCICCGHGFEIISKHGGQNRMLCYGCLPAGLPKRESDRRRKEALVLASNKLKESIGCAKCGYSRCATALEWHHHEDNKTNDPSVLLARSWNAYIQEAMKCILLCSNCHREFHSLERKIDIFIDEFIKMTV